MGDNEIHPLKLLCPPAASYDGYEEKDIFVMSSLMDYHIRSLGDPDAQIKWLYDRIYLTKGWDEVRLLRSRL